MRGCQNNEAFDENAVVLSKQKVPTRFYDGASHIYGKPLAIVDLKDGAAEAA